MNSTIAFRLYTGIKEITEGIIRNTTLARTFRDSVTDPEILARLPEVNNALYLRLLSLYTQFRTDCCVVASCDEIKPVAKGATLISVRLTVTNLLIQNLRHQFDKLSNWPELNGLANCSYINLKLEFLDRNLEPSEYTPHYLLSRVIVNTNTRRYFECVAPPTSQNFLAVWGRLEEHFPRTSSNGSCDYSELLTHSCLFGSVSLSLFAVLSSPETRPRDIDLWIHISQQTRSNSEIKQAMEEAAAKVPLDAYFVCVESSDQGPESQIQQHFDQFAMYVNAAPDIRYELTEVDHTIVKRQAGLGREDAAYNLQCMEDLIFDDQYFVYYRGRKVLHVFFEIFRKHLRPLETRSGPVFENLSADDKKALVLSKDVADFQLVKEEIKKNIDEFNPPAALISPGKLIGYLALCGDLNHPLLNS